MQCLGDSILKSLLKRLYIKLRRPLAGGYRHRVVAKCRAYGARLSVNFYRTVTASTVPVINVNFNGMAIRSAGKVLIGDNFHAGRGCLVLVANHNCDCSKAILYDSTVISRDLRTHDNARLITFGGVTLECIIIYAGIVVTKGVLKCAIMGGYFAQVFQCRDREHYECLEAEGWFH